jgi:tRNA modification GTPase
MNHLPEDRVVLLTPEGRGAVASLRVEGPHAAEFVSRHFVGSNSSFTQGRIHVGRWGKSSPEEVVVCRLAGELFEVHCHGGAAASRRIIADLMQAGCEVVSWPAWIDSQESNPVRATARALLAETRTERTAAILIDQYNGALDRAIDDMITAAAEAMQSDDAATVVERLDELLARAAVGLHLVEPWRVVLVGPPNAGKSSLINALVGYRRSIVHDRPGTTRDAVSVSAAFDGWPIELIDTAGLRMSDDPLEIAGIDRGRQQVATAGAILLVFDAAQPWTAELAAMARQFPAAIVVHNKIDLVYSQQAADRPLGMATSALNGTGIKALIDRVVAHLIGCELPAGAAVPFAASHVASLREAKQHIERRQWSSAIVALRMIGGPEP